MRFENGQKWLRGTGDVSVSFRKYRKEDVLQGFAHRALRRSDRRIQTRAVSRQGCADLSSWSEYLRQCIPDVKTCYAAVADLTELGCLPGVSVPLDHVSASG